MTNKVKIIAKKSLNSMNEKRETVNKLKRNQLDDSQWTKF